MESLSKDILFNIGINLDLKDLLSFCTTSKHINSLLCRDTLWLYKINQSFPTLNPGIMNLYRNDRSWKQYYIEDLYPTLIIPSPDYDLFTVSKLGRLDLVLANLDIYKFDSRNYNDTNRRNYAIVIASQYGNYETIKYMVEHGAYIQTDGNYALRYASQYGHYEVVKLLIDYGADIHAEDNVAVKWANESKHYDIVDYLVSLGAPDPRK